MPKDLEREIDCLDQPDNVKEQLKKIAQVKNWEIFKEIASEYEWRGNFVWIMPARGSDVYDKYF